MAVSIQDYNARTRNPSPLRLVPRPPNTAQALSEEEELACLLRGDEAAFSRLVQKHQDAMMKVAMLFVSSHAVAEEVVQETWMGFFQGLERFQQRSSLKTWLFKILTNRARTRGKKEHRSVPFSSLAEAQEFVDIVVEQQMEAPESWAGKKPKNPKPEHDLRRKEARAEIKEAIALLPETQRKVVTMRDVEGADFRDVCKRLQISEANQRVLLHRGRTKLRVALQFYGDGI